MFTNWPTLCSLGEWFNKPPFYSYWHQLHRVAHVRSSLFKKKKKKQQQQLISSQQPHSTWRLIHTYLLSWLSILVLEPVIPAASHGYLSPNFSYILSGKRWLISLRFPQGRATLFHYMTLLLLLLLSRFSCVWLCVTPETAAHQAPLSLGFSRQ